MNDVSKFAIKVVVGLAALFLLGEYVERRILKDFKFNQESKQAAVETKAAQQGVLVVDRQAAPIVQRYYTTRDRVKADPAPSKPLTDTLIADADSARAADSLRIAKRDTLIGKLNSELGIWKNKPGPPRLTGYAEGMWDIGRQVPIVRAGADFRLLGKLSVTAAVDASPRIEGIDTRAMVGARWTFR